MGHKVSPIVHRIPAVNVWDSKWFARRENMSEWLRQEVAIRTLLAKQLKDAGIGAISVERTAKDVTITILAAKPGAVIGRNGQGLDAIRKDIERNILRFKTKVRLNIQAVTQPALCAEVIGQSAALEIEKRMPFRRVMKQIIEKAMAAGAQGVKVSMSGRLNGAEIARREVLSQGKMSLITIRSNVDYAVVEAHTIYGKIGIKVWIYRGESFGRKDKFAVANEAEAKQAAEKKR